MKSFPQSLAVKSALACGRRNDNRYGRSRIRAAVGAANGSDARDAQPDGGADGSFVRHRYAARSADATGDRKLALQRTSNVSTVRAANAIYGEWTELRGRLAGLALAEAAPVRGALTTSQQTELWNLGRTPKARFDRVFLLDAQRGNELAFNRIREEDATSNVQIHQILDEARPLISGYQAMLTADIGRFPLTPRMPLESVGSTIQ